MIFHYYITLNYVSNAFNLSRPRCVTNKNYYFFNDVYHREVVILVVGVVGCVPIYSTSNKWL